MPDGGFQIDRPIALVGMMGAGKSSIGRRLGKRLELPFVDSDDELEQACGMTISEIFRRFGETWFRERERRLIVELAGKEPMVIATGGGAFTDPYVRAALSERCLTVWLDSPVARLTQRIGEDRQRPLLGDGNLAEALDRLATRRRSFYATAHMRVQNDGEPPERIIDRIIGMLAQWRP